MGEYQFTRCRKSQYDRIKYLIAEEYRWCLRETSDVFVAWLKVSEELIPCGALLAIEEEGKYQVVSLYVEKEHRRLGIGTKLLEKAESIAASRNYTNLYMVYCATEQETEELHRFLFMNGFMFPKMGNVVFKAEMQELAQSYLGRLPEESESKAENYTELCNLPTDVYRDYKKRIGTEIPGYLDFEDATGNLLSEYSLAYIQQRQIMAFVVVTEIEGELYLNSAYMKEKKYASALIRMFQRIWKKADKCKLYSNLTVTAVNAESEQLISKLFSGAVYKKKRVYVSNKSIRRDKEFPLAVGFGGVVARTNALVNALETEGYEVMVEHEPGGLPVISIQNLKNGMRLYAGYSTDDGEQYLEFTLSVSYQINGEWLEDYLTEESEFFDEIPMGFLKKIIGYAEENSER